MAGPTREHLLARGKWAERANAFLTRAWAKGWLPPPELEPDALWSLARKAFGDRADEVEAAGRSADDVADFRDRFERLCTAVRKEAKLNALGQAMAYGQLLRAASNRLALGHAWSQFPELLETPLAAPIIVIGHMRSGTTRIHKLLAADPAHSHTRYCDAFHPIPASDLSKRAKSRFELAVLGMLNPWLQTIHPMAPAAVEEELAWISAALHHSIYETQWHIPGYSAFSEAATPAPIYREFARILRSDAAMRGIAERPRVMKVPAFAEDLPTLLEQFPDARLVVAQREREAVLRSAISLSANQMAVQSDNCDLAQINALWNHKITLREERMTKALEDWRGPITRLHFDELNADWEGAITRCYDELGLTLTPAALKSMQAMMASSAKGAHQAHSAQLGHFAKQS